MEQLRLKHMAIPITKEYHPIAEINIIPESVPKNDFDFIAVNDVLVISILKSTATYVESARFKQFLDTLIENGNRKIIVDLRKCKLVDSTFWGALIFAQRKIHNHNGSVRIVFDAQKQSVLVIATRMDKIFKMYEDVETAVDSFNNRPFGQTIVDLPSDFN
jgi:anti-anti-sigma factor